MGKPTSSGQDTPRYTQSITATVRITGPQDPRVDSHGVRGPGSHISVHTLSALVYVHDRTAARIYADAWIDAVDLARSLPDDLTPAAPHIGPALMIRAHGTDTVHRVFDPHRHALAVSIGQVTWLVHDQVAYRSLTVAWRQVKELSPTIFRR